MSCLNPFNRQKSCILNSSKAQRLQTVRVTQGSDRQRALHDLYRPPAEDNLLDALAPVPSDHLDRDLVPPTHLHALLKGVPERALSL